MKEQPAVAGVFRRWLALAVVAAAAAGPAVALERGFQPIVVETSPLPAFHGSIPTGLVDKLEYRGGLVLTSKTPEFGSLSGLALAPDGRTIYSVADTGYWFSAEIEEKDGRLTGLSKARIAPFLDRTGNVVKGKRLGDAEGLRLTTTKDGKLAALVSFEQVNNVRRFVANPDLASASSEILKVPPEVAQIPRNQGLEAIAIAPADSALKGAVVLIAERALDKKGHDKAWIVGGPLAGTFALVRIGTYDMTDAVFLPDGDMLLLERRFNFSEGLGMRIRRIAAGDIRPNAVVTGEVLLEADLRDEIDNMEGIAIGTGPSGETLVLVVSDDNNNHFLQRTLLLQFALPD